MNWLPICVACLSINLAALEAAVAADNQPSSVVALLEENAADLLPQLTNPNGDPGKGEVEKNIVFAGNSGIKITQLHRYCNFIDGWDYRIREAPKEGEYRYLRFAWKSDGLSGIMLQLHDDKDWNMRYHAGANKFGWESRTIAEELPAQWTLVTIDLFKDFGEREIHGIAFTTFDLEGAAGYFDHVYLGRSLESLDAIDASGYGDDKPLSLSEAEVESHYKHLANADASLAYRAYWTLAAADNSARDQLAKRLKGELAEADVTRIAAWIKQLDDDEFTVREDATSQLKAHLILAYRQLEAEKARTKSIEVQSRLEAILMSGKEQHFSIQQTDAKVEQILKIIAQRQKN